MSKPEKITAIVAIVQICKYYGAPSKILPILAIIIGAILEYSENSTLQGVLDGIILGAITTGGYGVIKSSAEGILGESNGGKFQIPNEQTPNVQTIKSDQAVNIAGLEPDDDRGV